MFPAITIVDKYKVRIPAFECKECGHVSQKTIDMTPFAGQYVRIWLDKEGTYSLDKRRGHFWQMAEFQVPHIQHEEIDTGEKDPVTDEPVIQRNTLPLDIEKAAIETWHLPA
jgi:hypothetical protein